MTFKYNFALNNADLPLYETLASRLVALSTLTDWFQAEQSLLTVSSGKITTWASRKTSTKTFGQATGTKQATLQTNQINGWSAADFVRASNQTYSISPSNPAPLTGNLAWVLIFKPALDATLQGLASVLTDSANRCGFDLSLSSLVGNSYVGSSVGSGWPYTLNAWNVVIFEKSTTDFRTRCNGFTTGLIAHNNACGTALMCLGGTTADTAAFQGKISDLMLFNDKILDNADTMEALSDYCLSIYGLTI